MKFPVVFGFDSYALSTPRSAICDTPRDTPAFFTKYGFCKLLISLVPAKGLEPLTP